MSFIIRHTKHRSKGRNNPLIIPLGKMEESGKENLVSLAPETPEEAQGPRRRGRFTRNGRKITIERQPMGGDDGTPKLFSSSDSEDGVRKMHGRLVLQVRVYFVSSRERP